MKKGWTIFLTACLFVACVMPAHAAVITDYTLEEKWDLQMQGSGFKGTVAMQVEGDAAFGVDEATWQAMTALLPGLTVDVASMPRSGSRETNVRLLRGDEAVGEIQVITADQQTVVRSDVLGEGYYQFSDRFDVASMFAAGEVDKWPGAEGMLMRVLMADDGWSDSASPLYNAYTTQIAMWMQKYMEVTAGGPEDDYATRMYCEIPADDVKAQIKVLLGALYQDGEMMSLLGQVLSTRESAAYLDGSMLDAFSIMLDMLEMDGAVIIERRYDEKGVALLDSISLPFADNSPVKTLTYAITTDGVQKNYAINGTFADGRSFDVQVTAAADNALTGSVRLDVAATDTQAAGVRAYTFTGTLDAGEETYDLENDKCAHLSSLSLHLIPDARDTLGTHEITLSVQREMTSKSSRRAATYIATDIALRDVTSGSALTVDFDCNTASPWTPVTLDTLDAVPVRLDEMDQTSLTTLGTQWQGGLQALLMTLLAGSVQP